MGKGEAVEIGDSGKWYPPEINGETWAGRLWAMGGTLRLPDADTRDEAEQRVRRVEVEGEVPCTGCAGWVSKDETHGRWASRYCDTNGCWESYKAANSDTCRRCHSPRWKCYC